jgi:hypothetical protein
LNGGMKDERPPRRKPNREPAPPVATLGELAESARRHNQPDWFWLHCTSQVCTHRRAVRLADMIAAHGADASSDVVRKNGRCEKCGTKGAVMIHPSIAGKDTWSAFPE